MQAETLGNDFPAAHTLRFKDLYTLLSVCVPMLLQWGTSQEWEMNVFVVLSYWDFADVSYYRVTYPILKQINIAQVCQAMTFVEFLRNFFLYCCFKTLSFHFVFINSNELRVFHVISGSLLISPARISSFCRQGLGSSQLYVLHRLWYSAFLNVSDIICFEVLYGNGRCLINYN